ncbi:MAG: hypothetical protein II032_06925 [Treponema sp.]|nr:hypothetical protein [Treponema sp.]
MKIHVSENIYLQAKNNYSFTEPKGIEVKDKGLMNTYFVN